MSFTLVSFHFFLLLWTIQKTDLTASVPKWLFKEKRLTYFQKTKICHQEYRKIHFLKSLSFLIIKFKSYEWNYKQVSYLFIFSCAMWQWKHRVLTTGPPGKPRKRLIKKRVKRSSNQANKWSQRTSALQMDTQLEFGRESDMWRPSFSDQGPHFIFHSSFYTLS